jgi:hypothetical protein
MVLFDLPPSFSAATKTTPLKGRKIDAGMSMPAIVPTLRAEIRGLLQALELAASKQNQLNPAVEAVRVLLSHSSANDPRANAVIWAITRPVNAEYREALSTFLDTVQSSDPEACIRIPGKVKVILGKLYDEAQKFT